ncbi:MAG: selenoneine synthase SenA [Rhodocyclaceae bacterium]|nr:selenoneine synthase SenA [Rhodocyclaceae bacterium]
MDTTICGAQHFRQAGRSELKTALADSRQTMMERFKAYHQALGEGLLVPYSLELNTPLWEIGHIGWFEEFWLARNPQRLLGNAADPEAERPDSWLPGADSFYHSGQVAHNRRWALPLPDAAGTLAYLAAVRTQTLDLLDASGDGDDDLYFFKLAIVHEDMHSEAWVYMAQNLSIPLGLPPQPNLPANSELTVTGGDWQLGASEPGFAFDNELPAHAVRVAPFGIDSQAISWRRYLPFVEAGGYDDARYWSKTGWAWRQIHALSHPRYLRKAGAGWQQQYFGQWQDLVADQTATHLTYFEAEAWCRWAGRRLPSEAEWEMAALTQPDKFAWGQVWEWTASAFSPFVGFVAHPYRDYSRAWFDGRPVLRGASHATAPRMRHPRYRNYFTPERNDIFAGFRSCAR